MSQKRHDFPKNHQYHNFLQATDFKIVQIGQLLWFLGGAIPKVLPNMAFDVYQIGDFSCICYGSYITQLFSLKKSRFLPKSPTLPKSIFVSLCYY